MKLGLERLAVDCITVDAILRRYWEDEDDVWHEFPSCVTQGKAFPQV